MSFEKFKLKATLLLALTKINFKLPTDVQNASIPFLLENGNVFIKSSTGSGKTAAFLLPILNKINTESEKIQSLIMTPTRELAVQIYDQLKIFSQEMKSLSTALLIGGVSYNPQLKQLKNAQIIVGTPGRVTDLLSQNKFDLNNVETLVLDEVDEILKYGFKKDIDIVFGAIPKYCQIGLFSATKNKRIDELMKEQIKEFKILELNNELKVNSQIENKYIFVKNLDKYKTLIHVIDQLESRKTIIFVNTKLESFNVYNYLIKNNIAAEVINGDKTQFARLSAVNKFKAGKVGVLVATDVVGRGFDVKDIDLVINFELSDDNEDFVHRIGRTGRHDNFGTSVTFIKNATALYKLTEITKEFNIIVKEHFLA
ncbi:DEAD/DEAH box helicase [Mesoplasma corruscae]|uniref:DEAD-box ATP-dependent RNA helicase n=1 Tax=Mesoplasma corruscae TaxID=216874 RepID=A0A2S5RG81_9MOLU|nr:DEAD/DEAH box helicase [Mesoplasma corruscae]PPE06222.1 DEAD-box ATP-dependent RNA helicase [Mesoplasma corruscae]